MEEGDSFELFTQTRFSASRLHSPTFLRAQPRVQKFIAAGAAAVRIPKIANQYDFKGKQDGFPVKGYEAKQTAKPNKEDTSSWP
jgi:hypothetical protein